MNMRFLVKLNFVILTFLLIISNNCLAASTDLIESRNFVRSLKKQINSVSNQPKEQAYQRLREIVRDNIDIQKIAKFVMGKHWKFANEEEREAFIKEYSAYLERLYVSSLHKFTNNEITIIGNQDLGNDSYLVNTRFSNDDGFVSMGYKIKKSGDSFYITDVIVNGISIVITQRVKFDSEIQEKGLKSIIATLEQSNLNNNF